MSCRTTISTGFLLILLSTQLFRIKWTRNAILYMHYSENKMGQAKAKINVCCNYVLLRISCLTWNHMCIIF